jgi:hypothetical protein
MNQLALISLAMAATEKSKTTQAMTTRAPSRKTWGTSPMLPGSGQGASNQLWQGEGPSIARETWATSPMLPGSGKGTSNQL